MSKELKKHKLADTIKWVIVFVLVIGLIGAVIGLAIKLDRQTTTTTIGGEAYTIGALDAEGEYSESKKSIYTPNAITVDGLKVTPTKDAEIKYCLFFYDEDDNFISATKTLTSAFNGNVPEKAVVFRVMITPTADKDGEVSIFEVLKYANMLTVRVDR